MPEKYQIDLALFRIEKAKERLRSAEMLLEAGNLADSLGRSYYAIFTAARSLLALKGLDSKKHSGVIAFFNMHFVKSGLLPKETYPIIAGAKADRERADYEDYVEFSRDEADGQLKNAKEFVQKVEQVLHALIDNPTVLEGGK
ncbi:MAG: HEPN protein [Deltaproteobacteria bacterium]|nr:HEPN protein [Deltaproteobacteria bacterium]